MKTVQMQVKKNILTAAFSLFCLAASAQAPGKQWDKTIGGVSADKLTSLKQTADGGYILGGSSTSSNSGDKSGMNQGFEDYWIVKLDATGNKVWDKSYGGNAEDYLTSLQQTADGGYILAGWSNSSNSGDKSGVSKGFEDFWIIKLDAAGNKVWDKTIGGNRNDQVYSVQQTADGGYILGGWSNSDISGDKSEAYKGSVRNGDFWVLKLDATGTKVWDKTIGGTSEDRLYSLQQTADGGYFLGGYSNSGISDDKTEAVVGLEDYWVVKLNASGFKQWDKTIGGSAEDQLASLQQTADGGYILGGWSKSGISGSKTEVSVGMEDFWVVKLDATGLKQWDKTLGSSDQDQLTSLQQTADGGYILGGWTTQTLSATDYWVAKLNPAGLKKWDKLYISGSQDQLNSLQQTADGGYILGGLSNSGVSADKSQASKGNYDYWVIKLAATVNSVPKAASVLPLNLYPNPTQNVVTVQFPTLKSEWAEVQVTDLLGRELIRKQITFNNGMANLQMPGKPGIYLLSLKAGNQSVSRKVVVE